jgi:branched-chain amino acid transport system substrate-binding protein
VDGKQLELESYDTKLDPATAAQQAQRAISQDKVDALLGPYTTSEALAVADIAENAKVVNFNYSAATPAITEGKKYVFRTSPLTTDLAIGMMQLAQALGATNGALLYDSGGFGLGAKDPVEAAAASEGVTLADSIEYPAGASDVSAQITAAAKGDPGAVFIAGSAGAEYGLTAKAMVEQGLEVPLIGFSPILVPDAVKIAGGAYDVLPGVYTLQCVDVSKPQYTELFDAYNAEFDEVPVLTEQVVQAAAAVDWLAAGFEETKGEAGEALATALENLPARETYGGLAGSEQQFSADDHDGYGEGYLVPYKVEDGKPVQDDAVTLGG